MCRVSSYTLQDRGDLTRHVSPIVYPCKSTPFHERVKHFPFICLFGFSLFGERHGDLTRSASAPAAPALARRVALFEVFMVYGEEKDNPFPGRGR